MSVTTETGGAIKQKQAALAASEKISKNPNVKEQLCAYLKSLISETAKLLAATNQSVRSVAGAKRCSPLSGGPNYMRTIWATSNTLSWGSKGQRSSAKSAETKRYSASYGKP